ncbi:MAG: SDR family oxidoreductase [Rhodocyclaceae bacterium]|nr:SDR family oxidoreductase [Rhodocyclaceae bacterium]MBX3669065.1 SDR family oxidoreductase [Rhodocyclaceae bacterium]
MTPGNIALVTGAGLRMGRAIALALANDGWDVAVHYRTSATEAAEVVADIRKLGRRAACFAADLADPQAVVKLVDAVSAGPGLPKLVVNNASLFEYDSAADFDYTRLARHMAVNCAAPVLLAREVHARMDAADEGAVINLLDQKLWNWNPDFLSYSLSKAALAAATTMLAQALAPKLRVLGVAPGLSFQSGEQSAENFAEACRRTPLGRSNSAADIAQAVCFLARARAVTGSTLIVDGGLHLWPTRRDIQFE